MQSLTYSCLSSRWFVLSTYLPHLLLLLLPLFHSSKTCSHPEKRVAPHKTCCQSVVADCCLNECNHAKRSQLLESPPTPPHSPAPFLQSNIHIGSITQWSEVKRAATHSWQRLTTRHVHTDKLKRAIVLRVVHTHACLHTCWQRLLHYQHSFNCDGWPQLENCPQ